MNFRASILTYIFWLLLISQQQQTGYSLLSSLKPTKAAKSSKNPASKSNAATNINTKESFPSNKNPESTIVRLNVGGTRYDVSRGTLERCGEGSKLANLISDFRKEGQANDKDPIFIDRNGRLFEYVLDYLRTSEVHLPETVSQAAVMKEFEYYGIHADMSKVHEAYCVDYFEMLIDLFIKKADAARIEELAIQTAAFVALEFSKLPDDGYIIVIPQGDYVLCQHEALLRARLLERGLTLVRLEWESSGRAIIKVQKLNKN